MGACLTEARFALSTNKGGPGYARMIKHLGKKKYEALRQETLRMQQETRAHIYHKVDHRTPDGRNSYPLPRRGRGSL